MIRHKHRIDREVRAVAIWVAASFGLALIAGALVVALREKLSPPVAEGSLIAVATAPLVAMAWRAGVFCTRRIRSPRGFVVPFRLETREGRVVYGAVGEIGNAGQVVGPLAEQLASEVAPELGLRQGDEIRPDQFEAALARIPRETGLDFGTLINPIAAIQAGRLGFALDHAVVDAFDLDVGATVSLAVWEGPLAPDA